MRSSIRSARAGFTAVELLIVITIILILVAILVPAVGFVRERARVAEARNDIMQMSTAISNFKSTYNVKYIPSRIVLRNTYNFDVAGGNVDADLLELKKIWPRLADQDTMSATTFETGFGLSSDLTLTGSQCLVFFLGGGQVSGGAWTKNLGFFSSATRPFNAGGTTGTSSPIMDFPTARLSPSGQFLDPWGTPYEYFTAKNGNDYHQTFTGSASNMEVGHQLNYTVTNDAAYTMPVYVYPCFETAANKFANSHSFQIISAGSNQKFGNAVSTSKQSNDAGRVNQRQAWKAGTAPYDSAVADGYDDIANFYSELMGVEQ